MVETFEDLNDVPLFSIDGTKIILAMLAGTIVFAILFGFILVGW